MTAPSPSRVATRFLTAKSRSIRKRTSIVLYPEDFRKQSQWHSLLDSLDLPYGQQTGDREPEELTLHISGAEFDEYIPTMPR